MSQVRRRQFLIAAGAVLVAPLRVSAQPAPRVMRVAVLEDTSENTRLREWQLFRKRLQELGYAEGKNLVVVTRYARGDGQSLPALAAELVAQKPDVIVAPSTPSARAAQQATSSIPIIFNGVADPVGAGLVASLARPGGNATGLSIMATEIGSKWIELLREIAPGAHRFGFVNDASNPGSLLAFRNLQEQARTVNASVRFLDGRNRQELESALETTAREPLDGLIVGTTAVLFPHRDRIIQFAAQQRLPVVYARREYVEAGGLLSYSVDLDFMFLRGAEYVHRILQGARPSDLPVEKPSRFEFVINLKTANQIGLTIPQWTLMKATKVIQNRFGF